MTSVEWADLVKTLGVPLALCVAAFLAGARKQPVWVFGWVYEQALKRIAALEAENAELRKLAARGMTAAEKVATKRPPRTTGGA